MKEIDKMAWRLLAKRFVIYACYVLGFIALGFVFFYVTDAIKSSQYAEIVGKALLIVCFASVFTLSASFLILNWKDKIKRELLSKSKESTDCTNENQTSHFISE